MFCSVTTDEGNDTVLHLYPGPWPAWDTRGGEEFFERAQIH